MSVTGFTAGSGGADSAVGVGNCEVGGDSPISIIGDVRVESGVRMVEGNVLHGERGFPLIGSGLPICVCVCGQQCIWQYK